MTHDEARALIGDAVAPGEAWAELGAGGGTFTRALLMANALHFASDAEGVLRRVVAMLPPAGKLLLVEYDRERGNPWVPYPVPLRRFRALAEEVGLGRPEEIGRRPSRYQGEMYAAVARRV